MDKDQLHYFSIAYRTHNFAAAARSIPMSTQGLIKSIRSLEAELGVPLFSKDENGMSIPTAYADELKAFADDWNQNHHQLMRSFRQIEANRNKTVLLGASLGIMGFLGSSFLEGFRKKFPDMDVSYAEMSDRLCDDGLVEERYGIGFTLAPYDSRFETVELYSTPVCLWVNESDPLSRKDILSIDDLNGKSLALPGDDYKCCRNILDRCREKDVKPATVLESSEMFWLYNFAYQNRGLAFSAEHLGELPFFSGGAVRCIPLEGVTWRFGISALPRHAFTEEEKSFRGFCIEYCKEFFHTAR